MSRSCQFCLPGSVFRIRITTIRTRIRMSVPTYAKSTRGINPAHMAKNDLNLKSAGTVRERDLKIAKA